jgi:hypothetical protein
MVLVTVIVMNFAYRREWYNVCFISAKLIEIKTIYVEGA